MAVADKGAASSMRVVPIAEHGVDVTVVVQAIIKQRTRICPNSPTVSTVLEPAAVVVGVLESEGVAETQVRLGAAWQRHI
jgi:hypothetical protein